MPSDRHIIGGIEHVLLHNPSSPAEQILVPVDPMQVEATVDPHPQPDPA